MKEIWKPIAKYRGLYEVSNLGRVRRVTGLTKLSLADVSNMKKLRKRGVPFHVIGNKYGVCGAAVFGAINRKCETISRRVPNRLRKIFVTREGYRVVRLSKNGIVGTSRVGRLVAEAFIGPRQYKMTVDHINRNRSDDRAYNLRYLTQSDQLLHRVIRCPWCKRGLHFNGSKPTNLVSTSSSR